ncbi:MAG: HEPN domain-containing protein [archaeon GB-1867-035]|nr:HEPN domain-containing protein [Candidatus Culexmicrobium profundum]
MGDYLRWLRRAEDDLTAMKILLESSRPLYWIVAFHAQQAVEKYLKAYLVYNDKSFRKTHDIKELIDLCLELDGEFKYLYEMGVDKLTLYSVEVRYPATLDVSREECLEAVEIAKRAIEFIRGKLPG